MFDGLLASFGGESELLERDFTNRLQEIEKEIEQEKITLMRSLIQWRNL